MGNVEWYKTLMTSNNMPAPLVAKASSESSNIYRAFMAFNGIYVEDSSNSYNCWATVSSQQLNSWLQIDYGEKKRVNKVALSTRRTNNVNQTPTRFKILGSDNETDWEELGYFHVPSWVALTTFELDIKESNYSIYRVLSIESATSVCAWVQVAYGYEEPSVLGSFIKGNDRFVLKGKEKFTLPATGYDKYLYSDSGAEVEWADDITRLAEIKNTDVNGRVELLIEDPTEYHTVRGEI